MCSTTSEEIVLLLAAVVVVVAAATYVTYVSDVDVSDKTQKICCFYSSSARQLLPFSAVTLRHSESLFAGCLLVSPRRWFHVQGAL